MLVTEAIILAGGEDTRLNPLTSPEHPKCLLPVANAAALSYALHAVKNAGISVVFVVVCGDEAAAKVQKYVQKESFAHITVNVVTAASESGSADAVRLVAHRLTGSNVVLMSGDTITDMGLSSVLFTHSIHSAGITTVLAKTATSASANTKIGKTPKGVDYVAIDSAGQRLLSYSYDPAQLRRISVPAKALQACSSMEITTDFRDACIYVLARPVIERIVLSSMRSIKVDVLPCIVNEQWQPSVTLADPLSLSRASLTLPDNFLLPPKDQADACLSELQPQWQMQSAKSGIFCATFLVPEGALCRRINTLQNLLEVNRELATLDASGAPRAGTREMVPSTVELGNKAVIASGCAIGEHTVVGDKSSVKRSVVGASCKIGSNVKILNSVLMDGCVVGDGVHIHNTVMAQEVSVGAKAQLRDCHVGPNYAVPENADHRDEALSVQ